MEGIVKRYNTHLIRVPERKRKENGGETGNST